MKRAVILLSGGLDSATAYGCAVRDGYYVYPLNVQYGQRHFREHVSALAVTDHFHKKGAGAPLRTVRVDFDAPIMGSALTDEHIEVPLDRSVSDVGDVPVTYVPARNIFLVGLAASYAEQINAECVYVGFNAVDYSGYPDCRPEFVEAMEAALGQGMKAPVRLCAPIIRHRKVEVVKLAFELDVPVKHTWSCYNPQTDGANVRPCGQCDSCTIRCAAFAVMQIPDPARMSP